MAPQHTYDSPIFDIITKGSKGRLLKAHQAILEQSPVFKAMCNGSFIEGTTQIIHLPEDEYHDVSCFIHYLYTGDIEPEIIPSPFKLGQLAARLYLLGDKYQVAGLKIEATDEIVFIERPMSAFLKAARVIYDNTATSDHIFRHEFRIELIDRFSEKGVDLGKLAPAVKEMLMNGGELASDIFNAQREALALLIPKRSSTTPAKRARLN